MTEAQKVNNPQSFENFIMMLVSNESEPFSGSILREKFSNAAQEDNLSLISSSEQDSQNPPVIQWNGIPYAMLSVNKPITNTTLINAIPHSYGLDKRAAEEIVNTQKSHVILSPLTKPQSMQHAIAQAAGMMVISQVIASCGKITGCYWITSDTLVDRQSFSNAANGTRAAIVKQKAGEPGSAALLPLMLWVGCRPYRDKVDNLYGIKTNGLSSFIGYEIDIEPLHWDVAKTGKFLYDIIGYLFSNGDVLQNGQSLGVNENEQFRVERFDATPGEPGKLVLKL